MTSRQTVYKRPPLGTLKYWLPTKTSFLKYELNDSSTLCCPLWDVRRHDAQWELTVHTLINSACSESTFLCVSSEHWQCWAERNTAINTTHRFSTCYQAAHWTANLHIYVCPSWCWQKRWPGRWSSSDPVAQRRRSCWTLSQRRNAARDAGSSTSDRPDRDTHRSDYRSSHTLILHTHTLCLKPGAVNSLGQREKKNWIEGT